MFGPWRYWADGLELADAGRVPAQSLQWGALYTPAISKLVLNSFHGGSSYLLGASPLPAMGALLWVASTGLAAGLWALGRELGLRLLSPLLPLLTLTLLNDELRRNLDVYTAENVGRMVAVCGLVVGVRALRDREGWLEPVVAAVLFGAGFATHGVPVVALMIALGWYGVARLVLEWDRGAIVARMAVIAVGAPALTVGLLLSAGGTIGFQGASGADRYGSFGPGVDPTASLLAGTVEHSPTGTGHWFIPPHGILTYFLRTVTTLDDPPRILLWVIPIAAIVAAVAMARLLPVDLGSTAIMAVGLGLSLVALAFLFSYRYTHADPGPVRHRSRVRLPAARPRSSSCWRRSSRRSGGSRGCASGRRPRSRPSSSRSRPSRSAATVGPARTSYHSNGVRALSILDWVAAHVPCDARILPDRVTLGTFVAATGRVSVVEGMGPYLRPEMLHPVLADVLRAHRFFERPAGGRRFLRREGRRLRHRREGRADRQHGRHPRLGRRPGRARRRRLPAPGVHEPRRRRLPGSRLGTSARLPRSGRLFRLHVHPRPRGGRVVTAARALFAVIVIALLAIHDDGEPSWGPHVVVALTPAPDRTPLPVAASGTPIKHIIFLVKENRTYDNLYGLFPGGDGAHFGVRADGSTDPAQAAPRQADRPPAQLLRGASRHQRRQDERLLDASRTSPATSRTWPSPRPSPGSSRPTGAGPATTS